MNFRFVGGGESKSESDKILQELRAEAMAYGFRLEIDLWPDGIPLSKQKSALPNLPTNKASLPKRAQEILYELLVKHYWRLCDAWNAERRASGQKPIGDPAMLAKLKAHFEKAYYGKRLNSEKWRMVVDFLRAWHGSRIIEQYRPTRTDSELAAVFKPLRNAVESLDVDFLKLLAQAAEMLDTRIRSCKDANIGTGDTDLDLWLLQYGMRIAGTPTHTLRELNEQFVSKFREISDPLLRRHCRRLMIPLKPDVRGYRAVRYGTSSRRKKD